MPAPDWQPDDAEQEDYRGEYTQWKENIVVAIDCGPAMHTHTDIKGEENRTWFSYAVDLLRHLIKQRSIASDDDKIAVLLYGTELQHPDVDQVKRINAELDDAKAFEQHVGTSTSTSAEDLHKALWAATEILRQARGRKAKRDLWLMTNQPHPEAASDDADDAAQRVVARAKSMVDSGIAITLLALCPKIEGFDMTFWAQVVAPQHDWLDASPDQLPRPDDATSVKSFVRKRGYRQRALTTLGLQFSDDFQIDVSLFALLLPAPGPRKVNLHTGTGRVVRSITATAFTATGQHVSGSMPVCYRFPKPDHQGGHPTVTLQADEFAERVTVPQQLKQLQPKGLHLLGFRPMSDLQQWHQLRSSYFVYPNERSRPGSTTAMVRSNSIEPRLVALLPQEELLEEGTDAQVQPPGFNLVFLPYADDIRAPERDPSFVGADSWQHRAPREAVEVACAVISQMTLSDEALTRLQDTPNPTLQRLYQVLETQVATDEEEDEMEAEAPGFVDPTLPESIVGPAALETATPAILKLKTAVYGDVQGPRLRGAKAAGPQSKKRAAGVTVDLERLEELRAMGEELLLTKKGAELEVICEELGLPKSGNKQQKVQRIQQCLQEEQVQQLQPQ